MTNQNNGKEHMTQGEGGEVMRNKILIVDANPKEKEELETILQSVVVEGGELFFAEKKEDALTIIQKERPQLVFLDISLMGNNEEEWAFEGVYVVVIREKHEHLQISEDFIVRPLRRHQVLEKCQEALNHEPVSQIPPM